MVGHRPELIEAAHERVAALNGYARVLSATAGERASADGATLLTLDGLRAALAGSA